VRIKQAGSYKVRQGFSRELCRERALDPQMANEPTQFGWASPEACVDVTQALIVHIIVVRAELNETLTDLLG
jgi:hypothetical protein